MAQEKYTKPKQPQPQGFWNISELTYPRFLRESLSFSSSYLAQRLITMVIFAMFAGSSNESLSGQISLVVLTLDLLSSGIRDFQKPISIVCGPFYSQADFFTFRVKRNQLLALNVSLYFCFLGLLPFLRPLYGFIGVEEAHLPSMMFQSYLYAFTYMPLITASNFLQGKTPFCVRPQV